MFENPYVVIACGGFIAMFLGAFVEWMQQRRRP